MAEDITDVTTYSAHDIVLSAIYLPILIQVAQNQKTITYSNLVQTAKELHPNNEYVRRSIPVTVGRRLNVLRQILRDNSLPDLSSVVVSASSGDAGSAYHLHAETERKKVYDTDWDAQASIIDSEWVKYPYDEVDFSEIKNRKSKPPSREELKKINSEYWAENKQLFPKWFLKKREEILNLLAQGHPVEECYKQVLERGE